MAVLSPAAAAPVAADTSATVPAGFRDELVWSGLSYPTAVAFSPDASRVFVAQKDGRDQGLRRPDRPDPGHDRGPLRGGLRLLGPRPSGHDTSTRTSRPGRTSTRCMPTTAGPRVERRLPDAARVPPRAGAWTMRPAGAADRQQRRSRQHDQCEEGPPHRLVPAVPEPFGRDGRVRARRGRRGAVRPRAARARASQRRATPVSSAVRSRTPRRRVQPVRRGPRRCEPRAARCEARTSERAQWPDGPVRHGSSRVDPDTGDGLRRGTPTSARRTSTTGA